jgi:predicted peptidase
MKIISRALALAVLTLCPAVSARAGQDVVDGFTARTFTAANGETMPYRLFIPDAGASKNRLPLVLYLHGGGGVGTDNRKQISGGNTNGTHMWTTPEAQRRHPAFVLAPQLPQNRPSQPGRADAWSSSVETVLEIVAAVSREFAIDSERLYVTGQSLGGYGTWETISRHPQMFAAAVPLCGGGDAARVVAARTRPIWAFHGAKDPLVPVTESRELVAALRRVGSSVKYTPTSSPGWPTGSSVSAAAPVRRGDTKVAGVSGRRAASAPSTQRNARHVARRFRPL